MKKITLKQMEELAGKALDKNETILFGVCFKKEIFQNDYNERERTFIFSNNNKYFKPWNIGYSLFAWALDGSENNVRIEHLMNSGKIEYIYIVEEVGQLIKQ